MMVIETSQELLPRVLDFIHIHENRPSLTQLGAQAVYSWKDQYVPSISRVTPQQHARLAIKVLLFNRQTWCLQPADIHLLFEEAGRQAPHIICIA
jgi:hypothetical protein